MKQFTQIKCAAACIAFSLFAFACNPKAADETATKPEAVAATTAEADPAKLKAEIQELETQWAAADNARDVNAIAAYYSDDAISMENGKPMLVGNAAIKMNIEESLGKREKGSTVTYEIMDVFGDAKYATEVGKATRKDATGKATAMSKYMAVWEKRNGKWICIRDISNDDAEKK